jgi:hypothetical protein
MGNNRPLGAMGGARPATVAKVAMAASLPAAMACLPINRVATSKEDTSNLSKVATGAMRRMLGDTAPGGTPAATSSHRCRPIAELQPAFGQRSMMPRAAGITTTTLQAATHSGRSPPK